MVKIIDTTVVSGINTGDQTSIVGITGTKAEFNTAVTDGNILFEGDGATLPIEISDVTDLSTELSGKAASSHTHNIGDITTTGTADSTTYLRGDGTWATPAGGGGGDAWTYVKLESDYINSTTTLSDTALTFTPESDKQYVIEGIILAHSSVNTNAARFGIKFGTGYTYGAANLTSVNGGTSVFVRNARTGDTDVNNSTTNTAHPATGQIYAHTIWGTVIYGGSAGGSITITGRSEVAGQTTTFKAGSFIRYREI